MSYQVGVDLGTTYCSAAAVASGGRPEIVPLGNRASVIPSVVFAREDGTLLVGEAAERRAFTEPARAAREFKRRVGDPTPISLGSVTMRPEALMAALLPPVLEVVTERQGGRPDRLALTHPANWGAAKRELFLAAADHAGLPDVLTVTEPEAAAIYYASAERIDPGQVVAVYDLGGGTFDAAVLRRTAEGFELIGRPEGIDRLGGVDFDAAVVAHVNRFLDGALDELDMADPTVAAALSRLRGECVDAKEALSGDTDVTIPVLLPGVRTEVRMTRGEFEAMIRPAVGDTIAALRRALRAAAVEPGEVSVVLLVGGSSRIPLVAQLVGAELGRPVAVDAHPKHAVSLGAALAAAAPDAARRRRPAPAVTAPPVTAPPVTAPPAIAPSATAPPAPAPLPVQPAPQPAAPAAREPLPEEGPPPGGGGPTVIVPTVARPAASTGPLGAGPAMAPSPGPTPPPEADRPGAAQSSSNGIRGEGPAASLGPPPASGAAREPQATVTLPVVGGPGRATPAQPHAGAGARGGNGRRAALLGAVAALALVVVAAVVLLTRGGDDGGTAAGPAATDGAGTTTPATEPAAPATTANPGPTTAPAPSPTTATTVGDTPATLPADCVGVAEPFICMLDVRVDGNGTLVVPFQALGYTPIVAPGNLHIHFYFPVGVMADNPAAAGSPDIGGSWVLHDEPNPFGAPGGRFGTYTVADARSVGATRLCALVADSDHRVSPGTGNCLPLPPEATG